MKKNKDKSSYYKNTRLEMISLVPKSAKKILEIGCGQGNFSSQLLGDKVEIWGVEPNKKSAQIAGNKFYKVLIGTLDETIDSLPNNYFDAIILNDVLEHLLYPWNDLEYLKLKLKNEGNIIASIPNVRYSKNLVNLLVNKNWEYTTSGILDATHFRFFTKKSILAMFDKCGYSVKKIKGINITKSFLYFPIALLVNICLLGSQLDIFFMQYAVVVKKRINN